jgi:hypothetical protein
MALESSTTNALTLISLSPPSPFSITSKPIPSPQNFLALLLTITVPSKSYPYPTLATPLLSSPVFAPMESVPPLPLPSTPPPPVVPGPPQSPTGPDLSPPASPSQIKELQVAVGYLLYYGRSVDPRVLTTTCALASEQASPTLSTMTRLDRLLSFVSAHPHGRKIYRASEMILCVHSDASYLSRPRAPSWVRRWLYPLHGQPRNDLPRRRPHQPPHLHPLYPHTCRMLLCRGGRIRRPLRGSTRCRGRAGNPRQPRPPPIPYRHFCDDEVAIGLANRTVCPKMSKSLSLDMRFHWLRLRDRIDQGQFRVVFVPGKKHLADFFTKALPVARHKVLAPFFAVDDDSIDSINLRLSAILCFCCIVVYTSHQAGVLITL